MTITDTKQIERKKMSKEVVFCNLAIILITYILLTLAGVF